VGNPSFESPVAFCVISGPMVAGHRAPIRRNGPGGGRADDQADQ
jgi:hypothetical protein